MKPLFSAFAVFFSFCFFLSLILNCDSAGTDFDWCFIQTKDPMVRISLDNYESIFAVSPSGIARYLTLLKPVDREEQKSYSFTVRTVTSILSFLDKSPLDMIDINNWAQFDKKKEIQTTWNHYCTTYWFSHYPVLQWQNAVLHFMTSVLSKNNWPRVYCDSYKGWTISCPIIYSLANDTHL